jgi:hypothetical protein
MNNLDVLGLTRMTIKQLREPFNLMQQPKEEIASDLIPSRD